MASDHQVRLAERELRAYLLHRVCALLAFAAVIYLAVITVLGPYLPWVYGSLGMCAVCVLGMWTTKRGFVTSTSIALVGALTTSITVTVATGGLQYNVISLFLLVVLAGLLLGAGGAIGATLISVLIGGVSTYLEATGVIIPHKQDPVITVVTIAAELVVVGILLFWSARGHRKILEGLVTTTSTLDRTEQRYAELIHDLADGVVVTDIEGVILSVNPAIERMVGEPASEFLGRHFWKLPFFKPKSIPPIRENFRRILAGEDLRRVEVEVETNKGRLIVDAAPRMFTRADGGIEVSATVRDITDRVRAAEELAQLEAQLQESQRLEALGRLAGGIAHDFNNWLTLIVANAELLHDDIGDSEELSSITEAAHRSTALTQQLLTFARRQVTEPQQFAVAQQLRGLTPMLERLVGRQVRLTTTFDTQDSVLIDPTQFEQVVMNLVLNASEAVEVGGRVELRAFTKVVANRPWVCVDVTDDGPGVPPSQQAHLFEPFFTTKPSGTGLGLATVHGIVTSAGGVVRLLPSEVGAHFRIRLPLADGDVTPVTRTTVPQGGRVLIVDDDDRVRRTVARVLEEHFDIETAPSGATALALLDERDFDVLLSDIRMPEMSGTELLEIVQQKHPTLRVILMSGYAQEDELADTLKANAFIAKPFSPAMLRNTVSDVLSD